MANIWRTTDIVAHLGPSDMIGHSIWSSRRDGFTHRRVSLKARLTKDYKTNPKITWALWQDSPTGEAAKVIYIKTQSSPTTQAESDFIGLAMKSYLDGQNLEELLSKLPPTDVVEGLNGS